MPGTAVVRLEQRLQEAGRSSLVCKSRSTAMKAFCACARPVAPSTSRSTAIKALCACARLVSDSTPWPTATKAICASARPTLRRSPNWFFLPPSPNLEMLFQLARKLSPARLVTLPRLCRDIFMDVQPSTTRAQTAYRLNAKRPQIASSSALAGLG